MGQVIQVIPKTTFKLRGEASETQEIILRDRISTVGFTSAVVVVRVHGVVNFSADAAATIQTFNVSESPEDRGTEFVDATDLTSFSAIATGTATPALLVEAVSAPIGAMLRLVLSFAQNTEATNPQELTIAVDLIGRDS